MFSRKSRLALAALAAAALVGGYNASAAEPTAQDYVNAGLVPGTVAGTGNLILGDAANVTEKPYLWNQATANDNLVIGQGANVTAQSSLKYTGTVSGAIAIGKDAKVNAFGQSHNVDASGSIAIGQGSLVSTKNSVAIGAGSTVLSEDNVVSVGSANQQRKIINVADGDVGKNSIDAVNGKQLYQYAGDKKYTSTNYVKSDNDLTTAVSALDKQVGTNAAAIAASTETNEALTDAGIVGGDAANVSASDHTPTGNNSIAIGDGSLVTLGSQDGKVVAANGVALGNGAKINYSAVNGTAIGQGAEVRITDATAIGQGAIVAATGNAAGSVALGQNSFVGYNDIKDSDVHGVVSVGSSAGTGDRKFNRRIVNVADAINDSDAATYGQLKEVKNSVADLGDAGIEAGIVTGKTTSDNTAIGSGAAIIGDEEEGNVTRNTAVGAQAKVEAGFDYTDPQKPVRAKNVVGAVALGYQADAIGNSSTALGSNSSTANDFGTAVGANASAGQGANGKAAAFGYNAKANEGNALALGANSDASVANGTAVGTNASISYGATNSVALGADSKATEANTVSVGAKGSERKLVNVAAGVNDTDAVNMKQFNTAVTYDKKEDGSVDYDSVSFKTTDKWTGTTLKNVADIQMPGSKADEPLSFKASGVLPGSVQKDSEDAVALRGSVYSQYGGIAIGRNASTGSVNKEDRADYGVALGYSARANVGNSVAIGHEATITAGVPDGSVAIGAGSRVADDVLSGSKDAVVSFGSGDKDSHYGATRRLINVSDGIADTDAATVGQIKTMTGVDADKGEVVQYDKGSNKSTVTFAGANGTTLKGVKDIELGGSSFVAAGLVPGTVSASNPSSANNTAIGGSITVDGENGYAKDNTALGAGASVEAGYDWSGTSLVKKTGVAGSTAIGAGADVTGSSSTAIGAGAVTANDFSTAIGYHAKAGISGKNNKGNATAIGYNAQAAVDDGTALGAGSDVYANGGIAIGSNASVSYGALNAVAIGSGSSANEANTFSVGSSSNQRRIVNVADGQGLHDAATVGQIQKITGVDVSKGNVVQYDGDNLNAGTASSGKLNLSAADGSAEISSQDGVSKVTTTKDNATLAHGDNSVVVDKDGTTVNGTLNVNGDFKVNGSTLATKDDITTVSKGLGNLQFKDTNAKDLTEAVNNNYGAIQTNTADIKKNSEAITATKEHIGVDDKGNFAKIDNGADTLTGGINANTASIQENSQAISSLGRGLNQLGNEVDSVGAISAALAGLHPLDYNGTGSRFQLAAAAGTYDGTQAMALGGFYNVNRDVMLSFGASTSFGDERKTAANIGATFRIGQGASEAYQPAAPGVGNDILQRLAAMDAKLAALEKQNKELVAANEEQKKEIEALQKK